MKVINGGIPGKPEEPVEIGNVYSLLALINIKRAEQLRQTDLKVNKIVKRIDEQRERDYGNFERQLKNHIESHGKKHGENLTTLGLQMVNDFPFGNADDVLSGDNWKTYLNPDNLTEALQQWRYENDARVLARGNDFYTKNDLRLDTLFGARGIKSSDHGDGWYDVTPVTYYGGIIAPANVKAGISYLPTLPYIQNRNTNSGVSLGVTERDIIAYGWCSKTVKRESTNEYFSLDDYQRSKPLTFASPGVSGDLSHDAAWLSMDDDLTTGYAATCYVYEQGIAVGLRKVLFGQSLSFDSSYTYKLGNRVMGDKVVTIPWDEFFQNKSVEVDHHQTKVYGGIEESEDGSRLTLFVTANLKVEGVSKLYTFRWSGDREETQCLLSLVESPSSSPIDVLPEDHPFHPVNGRGIFKPMGGHISARHYGNRTFFLEHTHDFKDMTSYLDQRGNLKDHPIMTEQRAVTHKHYSPLGHDLGRMLLTNDHTVINGQQHVDGDWSHYLCHYDGPVGLKATDFRFNHPTAIFPMAERTTLNHEFVNTLDTEGEIELTGMVWSNKNGYQGIAEARGKVGGEIYGKPAFIEQSDLKRFQDEHQEFLDFRGGLGYTALVVFNNKGKLQGLEVRTDHLLYMDVSYLDVKLNVDGEYRLTRLGERVVVNNSVDKPNLVSNARRWLMTDFYAHYRNGICHVVVQNPYRHVPAIFELELKDESVKGLSAYFGSVDVTGVADYSPVIMTLNGPCKPDPVDGISGNYSNYYQGRANLFAGEVKGAGYLVIEPGTQLVVNGDPFDIPPGLVARITPNTKQYVYLVLVNGVVETLVSTSTLTRGQLYAVVETNGDYELKII